MAEMLETDRKGKKTFYNIFLYILDFKAYKCIIYFKNKFKDAVQIRQTKSLLLNTHDLRNTKLFLLKQMFGKNLNVH